MLRREFLRGLCSCGAALAGPHSATGQSLTSFFCATEDTIVRPEQLAPRPVVPSVAPPIATTPATPATVPDMMLTPYGTAFRDSRWLNVDGLAPNSGKIILGVHFLEGNAALQKRVADAARSWLVGSIAGKLDFDFSVPIEKSQIRIAFDPGDGNYSIIGRYALRQNKSQKTMNLGDPFSPVIEHEFGHALGLEHEHMFPNAIRWRPEVVIADMLKQKWSAEVTTAQILKRHPGTTACIGDPTFNRDSVMMYPIGKNWGQVQDASGNWKEFVSDGLNNISARDLACVRGLYNT